jgi:hypothetical protein
MSSSPPVVAFGPQMGAGSDVDKLGGDAHPVLRFANAPLEHVLNAELASDRRDVDGLALVLESGIASQHVQLASARQLGDDVLGEPVAEIVVRGIAAHVGEGQHRDGGAAGHDQGRICRFSDCGAAQPKSVPTRGGDRTREEHQDQSSAALRMRGRIAPWMLPLGAAASSRSLEPPTARPAGARCADPRSAIGRRAWPRSRWSGCAPS